MANQKVYHRLTMTLLFLPCLLLGCSSPSSSDSSGESQISSSPSEASSYSELTSIEDSSSLLITSGEEESEPISSEVITSEVTSTSEEPLTSEGTSSQEAIWPNDVILAMFNGYTIPSYPLQSGDQLSYFTDDVNRMVGVTITTSNENAFNDYIHVLDLNTYHTYINYLNHYAVSTSAGGNLNVYFNVTDNVLNLTILGVDYAYYDSYFDTFIYENDASFPSGLIGQVYDETIGQIVPPFITSGSFSFFTRMLVSKSNIVIEVRQSSEIEFSDYYFLLWDEDWYMEGLIMNDEYIGRDSTNKVKLEVKFDGSTTVTISITLI